MATLVSNAASGNWTAAATWAVVDTATGSQQTSIANSTNNTTSYVYCPTFTGTNAKTAIGVVVHVTRLSTTGTFSVALSDDNGTTATREVTVDTADLPANAAWVFFKFGSGLALDGGTDYRVGIKGSSANTVSVQRSATAADWMRLVVLSDTAAPAAADVFYVLGEKTGVADAGSDHVVTMNETATTDYGAGQISDRGRLRYGTTAATNYYLKMSGNLQVKGDGELALGTSGARIPIDSTAVLEFDCTTDGEFILQVFAGGTLNSWGRERLSGVLNIMTRLTADAAATATSLTVSQQLSAKNGDTVAIASTSSQQPGELEEKALTADAGASSLTITAITYAHKGTTTAGQEQQAHCFVLDRNVMIRSATSTNATRVVVTTGGHCAMEWTSIRYAGYGSTASNAALYLNNPLSTTTVTVRYCVIRDCEGQGIYIDGATHAAWSVRDTLIYQVGGATNRGYVLVDTSNNTANPPTLQNVYAFGNCNANGHGFSLADMFGTIGGLVVGSRGSGTCFDFTDSAARDWLIDGIETYVNNAGAPVVLTGLSSGTINNAKLWATHFSNAITVAPNGSYSYDILFNGGFIGPIGFSGSAIYFDTDEMAGKITFRNFTGISGQAYGVLFSGNVRSTFADIVFENCDIGVANGLFTTNATADIGVTGTTFVQATFHHCRLGSATKFTAQSALHGGSFVAFQGQTLADSKVWVREGTISYETGTVDVSPGLKLEPRLTGKKLDSGGCIRSRGFRRYVQNGQVCTPSIKVRKNGAYNGAAPRLVLKANPAVGIDSDTALDTLSVGADTWETLTAACPAVDADGVLEFVVDCDGTAGAVFVDTFTAAVA